jgi:hypothetical protein
MTDTEPQQNDLLETHFATLINMLNMASKSSTKRPNARTQDEADDYSGINSEKCEHVVTTYILPSIFHFVAYLLGFFYFRINENEQLYALMEKVFLAVNQTLKSSAQDKVIRRLK